MNEKIKEYLDAAKENNQINGGHWNDWTDARHLVDTYEMLPVLMEFEMKKLETELNNLKNEENFSKDFEVIVTYMNDEIREQLHSEIAPCSELYFLRQYAKKDPSIIDVMEQEFKNALEFMNDKANI